jgi:DNA-binding CsgD family transcriptional regulator
VELAAQTPPGHVLYASRDVPVELLLDTPMGRDLIAPQGLTDAIGVKITDSPLFVGAVSGYTTDGVFTAETVGRMDFLAPHLGRALSLHQRFSALQAKSEAFERSADAIAAGMVFLTPDGEVIHMNSTARGMSDAEDGLRLRDGRLVFSDGEDADKLAAAIREAMHPVPGETSRGYFRIARPSGARPHHAIVSPSVRGLDEDRPGALLLWITDPDQVLAPSSETLSVLLDLTPAEARISSALAAGESVRSYAEAAGITENTARSTLKSVFSKTSARSQADLVRLIAQSIPSPPF